jgi:hypothetical protein
VIRPVCVENLEGAGDGGGGGLRRAAEELVAVMPLGTGLRETCPLSHYDLIKVSFIQQLGDSLKLRLGVPGFTNASPLRKTLVYHLVGVFRAELGGQRN